MDKWKASGDSWRIRENTLLLLAFLGPFGAFAAMRIFHHKTRKTKFLLVPVFAVVHGAVLAYLVLTFI